MSEFFTSEMFSPDVGRKFLMRSAGGYTAELELISVTDLGSSPRQFQFSVVFRGPADGPTGQGICRIEHDRLGDLDLFLVTIGRDEDGMKYEAVFNRVIE